MHLDTLLPTPDVFSRHEIFVPASPRAVYEALTRRPAPRSRIGGALMGIRSLLAPRHLRETLAQARDGSLVAQFQRSGFTLLHDASEQEVVLGLTGRFWRLVPEIVPTTAAAFPAFARDGYAKAGFNFTIRATEGGTRLTTETRVVCYGAAAKRRFKLYWRLIAPFSGLIRREMLRGLSASSREPAGGGSSAAAEIKGSKPRAP